MPAMDQPLDSEKDNPLREDMHALPARPLIQSSLVALSWRACAP